MAHCGVLPEEIGRRQPFAIDVDVDLDLTSASRTDELEETVDYGSLVASIDALAQANRYGLLERFAGDIAELVLSDDRVHEARVTVRKLRPPVAQDLGSSGVTVRRRPVR